MSDFFLLAWVLWASYPPPRQPFDDFLRALVVAELARRYYPADETSTATPRAWVWPW